MESKLIDVSSYQGKPKWDQVRGAGYDGAIIRIRNSKGVDSSWEYNYQECGKYGLDRGAYPLPLKITMSAYGQ